MKYFQHSCDPNVDVVNVYAENDIRFPQLAFFANRDIDPMVPLTIYYGWRAREGQIHYAKCLCGSSICTGYLYEHNPIRIAPREQRKRKRESSNSSQSDGDSITQPRRKKKKTA